jgi:hypothetical protein
MEQPQQQNKIAPFLQDLGYGSTFSANVILAVLEQLQIYPSNASSRITPQEIGAILSMMARTHSGLQDNSTLSSLTSGILDEASQSLLDQMQTWNLELFFPLTKKIVKFFAYHIEPKLGLVTGSYVPRSPRNHIL